MGTCASRTVGAPVSHQKARISFDLHGCVTWMSTPLTALEPLNRSSQPARLVVLDDPRLQVDLVDHRSLAGCSMHSLGSGQRVAARARWRGRASRRTSAIRLCGSEQATMCPVPLPDGGRAGTGGRDFVYAYSSKSARLNGEAHHRGLFNKTEMPRWTHDARRGPS